MSIAAQTSSERASAPARAILPMPPNRRLLPALATVLLSPFLPAAPLEDEIDAAYREPRAVGRVQRSLTLCEQRLAKAPEAPVRWRAARACAWLAKNADDKERRSYAERGAAFASEAMRLTPAAPEGCFYYSLNLGILSRID